MKPDQMTETLEAAAAQLGIRVRYEPLPPGGVLSGGGLCRIHGQWNLIVDKKTSAPERAAILSEALASFDLEAVTLPTKLRQMLEVRRAQLQAASAAATPPAAGGTE